MKRLQAIDRKRNWTKKKRREQKKETVNRRKRGKVEMKEASTSGDHYVCPKSIVPIIYISSNIYNMG